MKLIINKNNLSINIILGDQDYNFHNENKTIKMGINYEHTLVKKMVEMLTPYRFYKFKDFSCIDSHERMRYLMKNHVLTDNNVGALHYNKKDLVIFNNRKLFTQVLP